MNLWPFSKYLTSRREARERDAYVQQSRRDAEQESRRAARRLQESTQVRLQLRAHNESNAYGAWMETLLARSRRGHNA